MRNKTTYRTMSLAGLSLLLSLALTNSMVMAEEEKEIDSDDTVSTVKQNPVTNTNPPSKPPITLNEESQDKAQAIAKEFNLKVSVVTDLRQKDLGWGEIKTLLAISQKSGQTVDAILALRQSGMGWGEIARKFNLNLGQIEKGIHANKHGMKSGHPGIGKEEKGETPGKEGEELEVAGEKLEQKGEALENSGKIKQGEKLERQGEKLENRGERLERRHSRVVERGEHERLERTIPTVDRDDIHRGR